MTLPSKSVHLRPLAHEDWPAVLQAAHASAPWAGDANLNWLRNRQEFDEASWIRYQYVAEDPQTQQVIGYGSVEEGQVKGTFRVFIVLPPILLDSAGQRLFNQLIADLKTSSPGGLWAREEGRDVHLLAFFLRQGFVETRRIMLEDGIEVVLLERSFA